MLPGLPHEMSHGTPKSLNQKEFVKRDSSRVLVEVLDQVRTNARALSTAEFNSVSIGHHLIARTFS